MKKQNIFRTGLFFFMLVLSIFFVQAFEVQTLDGNTLDWQESFCLDDPDNYVDLVGEDYYAYCEYDFSQEYNSVTSEPIENVTQLETEKSMVEEIVEQNNTEESFLENDLVAFPKEDFTDKTEVAKENNWQLFLVIAGIVLLLTIIILIVAHYFAKKRDEKQQILNLNPYLNTLRKKGYTEYQLEMFLINRGYDSTFINKLLNK